MIYYRPTKARQWKRFYKDLLTENSRAIDVGAHVGSRARAMRNAGAKVIALEPQMPFSSFLEKTLPADIELIAAAAGESKGTTKMSISSKHPTVSSLKNDFVSAAHQKPGFERVIWDKQQKVEIVTLDQVIAKFGVPDYIKIDVEGFELEVLKGLSKGVKMISLEILPAFPELSAETISRLQQLGSYEFNVLIGEKPVFAWSNWGDQQQLRKWMAKQPANAKPAELFARLRISAD